MTTAPEARLSLSEEFSWRRFRVAASVEVPSNPGGAYAAEIVGDLHSPDNGDGQQVWQLVVTIPGGGDGNRPVTISKKVSAGGWHDAVEYARLRCNEIAVRAAVAHEARRLFNEFIGAWTSEHSTHPLVPLDIGEGAAEAVLVQVGNAYSGNYRVATDPFDDTPADEATGQGVN